MKIVRKDIFGELDKVRKLVAEAVPDFDMKSFSLVLGRLGTQHYKKTALMLGVDRKIYDLLVEKGYNPYTVYKWSLLERIPEDVRYQLKNGLIGQKRASRASFKRRRETETSLQLGIKQQGLILVRGM